MKQFERFIEQNFAAVSVIIFSVKFIYLSLHRLNLSAVTVGNYSLMRYSALVPQMVAAGDMNLPPLGHVAEGVGIMITAGIEEGEVVAA